MKKNEDKKKLEILWGLELIREFCLEHPTAEEMMTRDFKEKVVKKAREIDSNMRANNQELLTWWDLMMTAAYGVAIEEQKKKKHKGLN